MTPTNSPVGGASGTTDVDAIPQPSLATIDLGADEPGFDGTGSFFSYDSDLSPDAALGAYAAQLIAAGFREIGSQGAWRMFSGPNLTVWFRVGSGGPPTSLLVRVTATAADSDIADPSTSSRSTSGTSSGGSAGPRATLRPALRRQPDPPHGGTGDATAAGGSRGTTGGGTATGGTTGTGTTGASTTGGSTTGGGTTGGWSGTGTGGGGNGLRP